MDVNFKSFTVHPLHIVPEIRVSHGMHENHEDKPAPNTAKDSRLSVLRLSESCTADVCVMFSPNIRYLRSLVISWSCHVNTLPDLSVSASIS